MGILNILHKIVYILSILVITVLYCNAENKCNVGEVAKAFVEAIIKRDFDTYMKYDGRWRINLNDILEKTPEFDRERKKQDFVRGCKESFFAPVGYMHNFEDTLKYNTPAEGKMVWRTTDGKILYEVEIKPAKILQIKPSYDQGKIYDNIVYIDTGVSRSASSNFVAEVYVNSRYCVVIDINEYK